MHLHVPPQPAPPASLLLRRPLPRRVAPAPADTQTLTRWIEADFQHVGLGVPRNTEVFTEISPTSIAFRRKLTPTALFPVTIRYELLPSTAVTVAGETIPLFEIRRYVNGMPAGTGPANVVRFEAELRDADDHPAVHPATATAVLARLVTADPSSGAYSTWEHPFRLPNCRVLRA